MGNTFYFPWEVSLTEWLQSLESDFLVDVSRFFTYCGEEYFLILVLGLLYWCINKNLGRRVALSLCAATMFGTLLKGITLRRRPYMDHESIKCLRAPSTDPDLDLMSPVAQGYSMPSLHSTMSFALYGSLAANTKKAFTVFIGLFMPLCIGLSRIYLGAHYATDVLAGWVLGIISIFVFGAIEKRFGYKIASLIIIIIGFTGIFYCRNAEYSATLGLTIGIPLGFVFEEKFVNFEMPKKWWSYILRPVSGGVLFIGISILMKLAVKNLSLPETDTFMLIYRMFRYILSTFLVVGVYPLVFKLFKKK